MYKQEKNIHTLSKEILNGVSKAFLEKLEFKNWQNQVKGIKVNFKLKDTKINDGLDSGDKQ